MTWRKSECSHCQEALRCALETKYYVNYCGSRRERLASEIKIGFDDCRQRGWLKTKDVTIPLYSAA
ncbi:MAG: hypothetical protein A2268_15645 [Candidatus Raymondbacteria bacterium RifOxyA12_full_50_37]|uniref:Uncharacterized protein n=1 Tax=Candidatus Raymondbacteria bacterium RIFOXYD12_FULL_49_13 TaxID=1817890 RepID=A0A1F7FL94_UNCRA|nr:MAG: hypothetical protein A2268_15645 [Candidatus Raymondbacteria bacterium RifOxyA12_full_50_37]OGJ86125.1 MAG: hypothetical protein A2248_22245 [Candidatus Raymondbacteria bacterium RIFOXYA2_FULL_49_16]OGJ94732.1 MAG: hypothetical protein A2350_12400 [Candidatus Raymondbacteria bacterium RifOxyB12_full_50_8]OGJ96001.1 MAG: hypothetical protein A2453_05195 [Candidatus Raymondbacteria bacterium RIFOXYC2_FULL_50_21]OGK07408.1 MAG: hypothetical protein A2519_02950 [Candidatus Raymondbacteria b